MHMRFCWIVLIAALSPLAIARNKPPKAVEPSPLDQYINDAVGRQENPSEASAGSLWAPTSRYTSLASDLRASQVDDTVTILVTDQASAVVQGTTKTQRQSNLKASITAAGGVTRGSGPLANLANVNTQSQLNGQGATSRSTQLSTTLTARVLRVLPNGNLVVEASKEIVINSEKQLVTVRGVIRPVDLTTANVISSNQIAELELKINGKGVVGDAIHRPFILWRVLLGVLPF
jgi:flagellar L-ring protein FlgH